MIAGTGLRGDSCSTAANLEQGASFVQACKAPVDHSVAAGQDGETVVGQKENRCRGPAAAADSDPGNAARTAVCLLHVGGRPVVLEVLGRLHVGRIPVVLEVLHVGYIPIVLEVFGGLHVRHVPVILEVL